MGHTFFVICNRAHEERESQDETRSVLRTGVRRLHTCSGHIDLHARYAVENAIINIACRGRVSCPRALHYTVVIALDDAVPARATTDDHSRVLRRCSRGS